MAQAPRPQPVEAPAQPITDALLTAPLPLPAQCPSQDILAGVVDNFSTANGVETPAPSATLQATISGPYTGFDGIQQDRHFIHTFRLPPCKCLVGAKLEFRLKSLGPLAINDSITLGFSSISGFPRWSATIFGPPLNGASGAIHTLDLAALPLPNNGTTSLLSSMQMNKYLDVYIQDDMSVDYLKLTATMCDCCQPTGRSEICVTKFNDLNRNGVKDSNEPFLQGWTFVATDVAGGNVVTSQPTNATGRTCLGVLAPATYTISEVTQGGWVQTTPTNPTNPTVTVTPGGPLVNLTFGNWLKKVPDPVKTGDQKD